MKITRAISVISVTLCMLLVFTACGSKYEPTETGSTTETTGTTEPKGTTVPPTTEPQLVETIEAEYICYDYPDFPVRLSGTVYYVDWENGSDNNTGTSPDAPFKNAPGNGSGNAAATVLQPGDKIIFKGGVAHRAKVVVKQSGTPGMPIVYDGNTEGTFGEGRAIIDGSETLTGWQRCETIEETKGNPLYQKIFYIDIPGYTSDYDPVSTWKNVNLSYAGTPLPHSQAPNPSDPMFQENPSEYFFVSGRMSLYSGMMKLTDPANLQPLTTVLKACYQGMTFGFHGGSNLIQYKKITDYDPETHTLSMELFTGNQYASTRYSLFNSVGLIDVPGEFSVEPAGDQKIRIYLLPPEESLGEDGLPRDIRISVRNYGFEVTEASNIVLQGFDVRQQGTMQGGKGGIRLYGSSDARQRNILIRDCNVSLVRNDGYSAIYSRQCDNVFIEDCRIYNNPGHIRGILIEDGTGIYIRNNILDTNTSTGMLLMRCENVIITGNKVLNHRGMHANGISVYNGCKNVYVEGNLVKGGNIALTVEAIEDVTVYNNILDGNKNTVLGMWNTGDIKNLRLYHNALLNSNHDAVWQTGLFSNNRNVSGFKACNNIIDGLYLDAPFGDDAVFCNNIYTREVKSRYIFEKDMVCEFDLNKIFVDPHNGDYRLRIGSPAINSGIDVGVTKDYAGTARPRDGKPDIGPFEFVSHDPE